MANNEDYGDIEGVIDAIPPAGSGGNVSVDPASIHWNAAQGDSATQAILAAIAEENALKEELEVRDRVRQALAKAGKQDKFRFLSKDQINALDAQLKQGKTITAADVDGLKVASPPTETSFGDYGLEEQLEDYDYDKAWGDIVNTIYGGAATTPSLANSLWQSPTAAQNQAAARNQATVQNPATFQTMTPYDRYIGAVNELEAWNARRGDYDETNINKWFERKGELTDALLAAKADFEASGGSTDPTLLDRVLGGVVTAGGTASNVLSGVTGAPTFSQMVYNLPGLLEGTLSGTFQYGDTGPNLPIKVGEHGNTVIAATTGIPLLDETIGGAGTVANEGLITTTGANIPSIGEVIASAGEVVNKTFDPTATFADEDTKDTKDTTVGVSTEGTITGGDGTDIITSGDGADTITSGDGTDIITNQTTQTDLEKTKKKDDPPEKTAPTFSGSIDTAPKYETVTTTDYIGPSLAASLGFTTEEAETLNDVLKGSLGFDTTTYGATDGQLRGSLGYTTTTDEMVDNLLKGSLGFDTTTYGATDGQLRGSLGYTTTTDEMVDNVLRGSLAGETTSVYDSSPQLYATLEGNVLKTDSTGPVLEGSLGGANKTGDVLKGTLRGANKIGGTGMPQLPSSVRGAKEDPGGLVDIDYLYDFAKGLDQPFLISDDDEEDIEKNLYLYAEGGTVANEDAMDMVTRRPGEYGRSYFTPGEFVPTGTAVGGAALDSNLIQVPQYTYERNLLPEFGGPPLTSTGTTAGTGLTYTPGGGTISTTYIDPVTGLPTHTPPAGTGTTAGLLNLINNLGIFGGGGTGTTTGGSSTYTPGETTTTSSTTAAGSTYTPGSGTSTTTSSVVANALNDYLRTLGYGLTDAEVTAANLQAALGENFTLAELADAFGTTEDVLNSILNPTSTSTTTTTGGSSTYTPGSGTSTTTTSVIANALNNFLVKRGFGTTGKNVTQADIQAALDSGFTVGELAAAFDTTEAIINSILNPTSTSTTTTGGSSTYTPGSGTSTTTTSVVSNALNNFLVSRGFGTTGKNVTQADIQAALKEGFTVGELAAAFDTTEAIINSILNPTSTSTTTTGGSSTYTPGDSTTTTNQQVVQNALNDFLVGRGFGTTNRNVTKEDIQAVLNEGYSLAELATAFGTTEDVLQAILDWVDPNATAAAAGGLIGLAEGGLTSLGTQGYYLGGPTDGMADQIPATIDGSQPAALSDGEFVVPADVVSHLGNGNSDAGAQQLHAMMDRVRDERTGTTKQGPEINPMQMLPV